MTECIFSEPVNLGTEELPDWEYSKMLCDDPELYELIENETTEAEFYLNKSFSYGDFFVMFILTVFVLFGIVKIIWSNFVKK
jgi:hypothetical protein